MYVQQSVLEKMKIDSIRLNLLLVVGIFVKVETASERTWVPFHVVLGCSLNRQPYSSITFKARFTIDMT